VTARLVCRGRSISIDRPLVMGIVNATPDSFSDGGVDRDTDARVERALGLVAAGAAVLDVGGQSAITGVPEISDQEEIDRVAPVLEGIRRETNCLVSIDTYKPAVAKVAIDLGADIINDISGVMHPALAEIAVRARVGFVVMHTRFRPKYKEDARHLYDASPGGVVGDVLSFLDERVAALAALGMPREQIVLDPGPDFAKTPAQTIAVLRALPELVARGRPVLLALSRKDFIGALTGRAPRERLAGTLASVAATTALAPSSILRVHDVAEVREFLTVLDALEGRVPIDPDLRLPDAIKWQGPKK